MIKDWIKFNEEKNYGDLYHSLRYRTTSSYSYDFKDENELFDLTQNILTQGLRFETNKHKDSTYKHPRLFDYYISTSRDKSHSDIFHVTFVIDAQKVSNHYRIVPFNKFVFGDYMRNISPRYKVGSFTSSNFPLSRKWSEEKIVSKNPGFLSSKYFKEIILNRVSKEFEDKLSGLLSELNLNIKIRS